MQDSECLKKTKLIEEINASKKNFTKIFSFILKKEIDENRDDSTENNNRNSE